MPILRLACLAALLAATASAQPSNWDPPTRGAALGLTAERPTFDGGAFGGLPAFGGVTSSWRFTASVPVGPARVVGELPFAFASFDDPSPLGPGGVTTSESGAALGNAQIGAELDLVVAPVTVGGYLRVPTVARSEDFGDVAQFVGFFANADRPGAYADDTVTLSAMVEGRPRLLTVPGLSFRLRALPQVLVATGDPDPFDPRDDAEVLVGYAAQAFYNAGAARVGGGFSGVSVLTEDADERHEVSVGILADAPLGPLRFGVSARLPFVGTLDEVVNAVVGLRISYNVL